MIKAYKDYFIILLLGIFSFYINFHYAHVGVMPMDNFVLYNGGYRVLKGFVPFNDYWLVTGPLLDYLNAFFFNIFGTNWKVYIFHSSLFNVIITLATYLLFIDLKLPRLWSLFYSALFSCLMYSVVGTPFVDHHSTIFLIIAFYLFVHGIHSISIKFHFCIPSLFMLSFLSKQTPAAYGAIGMFFLILIYIFLNIKEVKKIVGTFFFGTLFAILFLLLFFYFTKIKLTNFMDQYIFFAQTIGESRLSNANYNFLDLFLEYKFINIFLIYLIGALILLPNKTTLNKNIFLTILSAIFLSLIMIFHQTITFNQNFIFFLIPFLMAIIHIYKGHLVKNKNYIFILLLTICIFSVGKYHLRFNEQRKFNELEKVDLTKAIEAENIDKSLRGLKWITAIYPLDPSKEILDIKEAMNIVKNEKKNKTIITQYQFIAPVLSLYDYSPNQWHHPTVSFPMRDQKFFNKYKIFFVNQLKKNNIEIIYTIGDGQHIVELVLDSSCFEKKQEGSIIFSHYINNKCKDFK